MQPDVQHVSDQRAEWAEGSSLPQMVEIWGERSGKQIEKVLPEHFR